MVRRNRPHARRVAVAASIAVAAGFLAQPGPSGAEVTAVSGSAFGYHLDFDNSPPADVGPTPTVALPPGGSTTPVTSTAASGSAPPVFSSGSISVSTQGTPASGSVSSSAEILNLTEPFIATRVASTCTANETGVSGVTEITGAIVETDSGDDTHAATFADPPPTGAVVNQVVDGHLHVEGVGTENFQYIFNEQIVTANSITVNAVHLKLLGPFITGNLIIGQSVCAVTATAVTTTQPVGVTTTQPVGVTTTQPVGVTTTQPVGVTTTLPSPSPTITVLPAPTVPVGSIDVSALIRQIVCPILQQLAADPFLRPFIQPFLAGFGCTT